MSTEQALWRAVVENPQDDTVRLVYADWCEEHGDVERAEHIRLQIEQARLPEGDEWEPDPREAEIAARLEHLEKHEREWVKPLRGRRGPLRGRDVTVRFERGFPSWVMIPAELFLERAEAIAEAIPLSELLLEHIRYDHLERLAALPTLTRLTVLHTTSDGGESVPLGRLALSPHLGNLREWWLSTVDFTAEEVALLAAAPALANLRSLGISGDEDDTSSLRANALERLAEATGLSGLTEFYADGATVGRSGLQALAGSTAFAGLTRLTFCGGSVHPDGLRALAGARFRERLEELTLWGNGFGRSGHRGSDRLLAALTSLPAMPNLRKVDLSMNELRSGDAVLLAGSRAWPGLRDLDLSSNRIGPDGARALAASVSLANLARLSLSSTPIGDGGTRALADSPQMANLRSLDLGQCGITAEGAQALADSPHLARLRELRMWGNRFQKKGKQILRARFGDAVDF